MCWYSLYWCLCVLATDSRKNKKWSQFQLYYYCRRRQVNRALLFFFITCLTFITFSAVLCHPNWPMHMQSSSVYRKTGATSSSSGRRMISAHRLKSRLFIYRSILTVCCYLLKLYLFKLCVLLGVKEPAAFTKIAFGDGNYELTWEKPRDITGIVITNYTLFWCEHNKDRPYQCTVSK